jgi:hypothetical protein
MRGGTEKIHWNLLRWRISGLRIEWREVRKHANYSTPKFVTRAQLSPVNRTEMCLKQHCMCLVWGSLRVIPVSCGRSFKAKSCVGRGEAVSRAPLSVDRNVTVVGAWHDTSVMSGPLSVGSDVNNTASRILWHRHKQRYEAEGHCSVPRKRPVTTRPLCSVSWGFCVRYSLQIVSNDGVNTTGLQILCFWTLFIVLFSFITPSRILFKTRCFGDWILSPSSALEVRWQGLALSIWPNWVRFYLKTKTETSIRNVVFLNKNIIGGWIVSRT